MAIEPKLFTVEKDGAVVVWKFYNLPSNLWNVEARLEFVELTEEFYADPSLRVGIFTSAMPDVFIQHYDVSLLVKRGEELLKAPQAPPPPRPAPRGIWRRGPKPVIAAINASLSGGGLELAMTCDFRFMARGAAASQGEVNVGILPGGGGTQRMPRLTGLPKALELELTGQRVFADEAEYIGLVTKACEPALLMTEVMAFAKELASKPPLAVEYIRRCVYEGWDLPLAEGLELERKLFIELVKSPEALQRMRDYVATGQDPKKAEDLVKKWQQGN
ncbi:MAG: enoyl-CoA hydratase/isomerase family protein [Dehalococcoidia bacterium]|nr:enoyl-CoA hydratase/isomerase family protein [Dehalococcoidia bacterium]